MKLLHKQTLNYGINLKIWIPLLQSNTQELNTYVNNFAEENPFVKIHKNKQSQTSSLGYENDSFDTTSYKPSLYETVLKQITPPLFPTPISQNIAMSILENINEEGYLDEDLSYIAKIHKVSENEIEKIRKRFRYMEPKGIGSLNLEECLLIQLDELTLDERLYNRMKEIILHLDSFDAYLENNNFAEITNVFTRFSYPPALAFMDEPVDIVADFILKKDGINFVVSYNDHFTQEVTLDEYFTSNNKEIKQKVKEVKELVNLLQLRKETLHKIVLLIVEIQKEFFFGRNLKPLIMQTIADELSLTQSTISRAISNKYLECDRGIFPLKHFFTNQVKKEELSSNEVKEYLQEIMKNENSQKPYSDESLVPMINEKFAIKLSRRVIAKYRLALGILSSRDRKKLYQLKSL